jgi:hypothetical protein
MPSVAPAGREQQLGQATTHNNCMKTTIITCKPQKKVLPPIRKECRMISTIIVLHLRPSRIRALTDCTRRRGGSSSARMSRSSPLQGRKAQSFVSATRNSPIQDGQQGEGPAGWRCNHARHPAALAGGDAGPKYAGIREGESVGRPRLLRVL